MSLRDRTGVITGAASGIGIEIARKFVAEGAAMATVATRTSLRRAAR